MKIYWPQIGSSADSFDIERGELGRLVEEAAKDLNGIGDFWGGGTEGVTFFKGGGGGTGYEAVTGQVMEGIDVFLDAHHEIALRLRLMADTTQAVEWDTVAVILSKLPAPDPGRPIWGAG
ncbi:hypothetical protein ACTMTI_44665 [Nonomuraea sp. H19]|uniref:hypothetical protein n=1 Tax=Nonomuraea sp. H19 TaxID=3452206 RepID=UPI003F8B56CD